MKKATSLEEHYHQLLQLTEGWEVKSVDFDMKSRRVSLRLEHRRGERVCCPECGAICTIADHAPERTWRHLDTMQYETVLVARLPRADCPRCASPKTVEAPWAGKHSPYTWHFESLAVAVLQAAGNLSDACDLLRIGWDAAHRLMGRAVERGLGRRKWEGLRHVGMDEKSFRRGQSYITTLNEVGSEGEGRVLEVGEGRSSEAATALLQSIPAAQKSGVVAVAVDMWEAFLKACREVLPQADIVHDKYHVSSHLNEAVNQVRKAEHKRLLARGDESLKGSKYKWLRTYKDGRSREARSFRALHQLNLKTSRAWHYKEDFRHFWTYASVEGAQRFYRDWRRSVMRSRLEPLKKVARMIDGHWKEILNYITHRITNAVSEGLNSRIQSIKSAARGFRSFPNYRVRILFHCGKLNMQPPHLTH